MTKEIKNENSKAGKDRVKYQKPAYNAGEEERSSRRERKLLPPAKRGTISRLVIRKVIKEVMEKRSAL
ncbi:MAG: hypothetical protein JSV88_12940 [Candidatus Aminicenantes bacterium]|nr:MAG: hypothetical protein JSV88_12940 [Candidatus Aminicenantes bacterium]